ncbi:helix-turn-helix domain-containing protein [Planococcus sp. CAU13]|uniref:helix-turn-helix domain-containing protein n=1 Tax=Planococcus sp. CAU13 TaxID=1541197 RepID=UPI00052FFFC8|nr:helix-turn-helix domain-containing protein [Planococcus sp. CAU13]
MNKIETILHPVRIRIIQQFLNGQAATAKQLANTLPDVPQATLYRQLDILVKAEILAVTEQNQIRGTIEKTYELNTGAAIVTNEEAKEMSKEDHLKFFMLFAVHLTKSFEEYLDKDSVDFERDGVGYRQLALHLSDGEFNELLGDLRQVFAKYIGNAPSPERTKRVISTIIIPEGERGKEDEEGN